MKFLILIIGLVMAFRQDYRKKEIIDDEKEIMNVLNPKFNDTTMIKNEKINNKSNKNLKQNNKENVENKISDSKKNDSKDISKNTKNTDNLEKNKNNENVKLKNSIATDISEVKNKNNENVKSKNFIATDISEVKNKNNENVKSKNSIATDISEIKNKNYDNLRSTNPIATDISEINYKNYDNMRTNNPIATDISEIKSERNSVLSNSYSKNPYAIDVKEIKPNDRSYDQTYILAEISIDSNENIQNYYPYFYKTKLIEYKTDQYQRNNGLSCLDSSCEICDIKNRLICLQCLPGSFLHEGKCYNSCPNGYVVDIFKRSCSLTTNYNENTFSRLTYLKAFSVGSCLNKCGSSSSDCSCKPECIHIGNCCTDYNNCENLRPGSGNCLSLHGNYCHNCKPGYFLRGSDCVTQCEPSDQINLENSICIKRNRCLVENCLECEDDNAAVCRRCINGLFLLNNQCRNSCPPQLRADRMSWLCLEPPIFAWYWVYPSESCLGKCNQILPTCSCRDDCYMYGNCCQDVEDYCYKFILTK